MKKSILFLILTIECDKNSRLKNNYKIKESIFETFKKGNIEKVKFLIKKV